MITITRTFETEKEAMPFMKADDLALFVWELKHNFWRKWKHDESDFTLDNYKEELSDLMYEYGIHPDELTE